MLEISPHYIPRNGYCAVPIEVVAITRPAETNFGWMGKTKDGSTVEITLSYRLGSMWIDVAQQNLVMVRVSEVPKSYSILKGMTIGVLILPPAVMAWPEFLKKYPAPRV